MRRPFLVPIILVLLLMTDPPRERQRSAAAMQKGGDDAADSRHWTWIRASFRAMLHELRSNPAFAFALAGGTAYTFVMGGGILDPLQPQLEVGDLGLDPRGQGNGGDRLRLRLRDRPGCGGAGWRRSDAEHPGRAGDRRGTRARARRAAGTAEAAGRSAPDRPLPAEIGPETIIPLYKVVKSFLPISSVTDNCPLGVLRRPRMSLKYCWGISFMKSSSSFLNFFFAILLEALFRLR